MFTLKNYQKNALSCLERFLINSRISSHQDSFNKALLEQGRPSQTYNQIFKKAPSVCLRVPTGGGKTVIAAHSVALAGKAMLDSDAPTVLWLTPSDTIRSQTLEALSNSKHPYRQALAEKFGDRIKVCDLESLQTINPQDVGRSCVVVVATIQAFNVTNTPQRNVYSFFEELAPHFSALPSNLSADLEKVTADDLVTQPYLTDKDIGKVKYSIANWLHLQNPIVIVDEAHNNRTDRFFATLDRLNPACVLELTATPITGNNVLYHVSAQELKAEQMIKLPIVLSEHPTGWRDCLRDAILTRDNLAAIAQKESDYIRPIALIQAAPIGNEATVSAVKQYLIEEEKIPEEQIAIATGTQKELDGINLFSPECKIQYVITVEALKEGWDCSFAYVLASLQSVNSSKDVEQLLGRVLRMPYAKNREQDELNKAYAHIVAENFAEAAAGLKDRMVQNMGFERLELASVIIPSTQQLPFEGGQTRPTAPAIPECHIQLTAEPDRTNWPEEIKNLVEVRKTTQGITLVARYVDAESFSQVEQFVKATVKPKDQQAAQDQFDDHRANRVALNAPATLGAAFAPIPQLCLSMDGQLELVEQETLSILGDWDLLATPVQLAGFSISEDTKAFEIDMAGEKVTWRIANTQQIDLNSIDSHVSEQDLVRWLDRQVMNRYWGITQGALQAYLTKLTSHLIRDRGFTLTSLVRGKSPLSTAITREIERLRDLAIKKGFQLRLMDMAVPTQHDMLHFSFQFKAGEYPARNLYRGSYSFGKHFYPSIHDLKEKTASGNVSEEFACALAIDANSEVKHWVRNIERQPKLSFWLPTSTDYFYPDFVAELNDGRVLVVEYKGEVYATNDDSREKMQVGSQWEKSSDGRCIFLFALARDENGRNVTQQISDKILGA
ncbi:Type III restriction protein res subunit [beta proteobacterium CB]|nr:Type III restriction protein res subunit [beta proteobacterium CB]